MYDNPVRKLAYLAHPRTASTSTKTALVEKHGFRLHPCSRNRAEGHHSELCPDCDWTGYDIATTIRHPCDAFVSWCHHARILNGKISEEALHHVVDRQPQYFPIPGRWWGLHYDSATTILRFENLQNDLDEWLGEPIELPWLHKTDHPSWEEVMSPGLIERFVSEYGAEMRTLGYGLSRTEN